MMAFPARFILELEWLCWKGLVIRKYNPKRSEKRRLTTNVACRADLVIADRSNHELNKHSLSWLRHEIVKSSSSSAEPARLALKLRRKLRSWRFAITQNNLHTVPESSKGALYPKRTKALAVTTTACALLGKAEQYSFVFS